VTSRHPVISIISQDVCAGYPDFYSEAASSCFDLATVAWVFGNEEPAKIMQILWGHGNAPTMKKVRTLMERAWYNQGAALENEEARGEIRPQLAELFIEVDSGRITQEQLTYAARVWQRYMGLVVREHGLGY
jgi:hypothetical protein